MFEFKLYIVAYWQNTPTCDFLCLCIIPHFCRGLCKSASFVSKLFTYNFDIIHQVCLEEHTAINMKKKDRIIECLLGSFKKK